MDSEVYAELRLFEEQAIELHDGYTQGLDALTVRRTLSLIDEESLHGDLAYILFMTLKMVPLPADRDLLRAPATTPLRQLVTQCVDPYNPMGDHVSVMGMRNWVMLFDALAQGCAGSLPRLAFKYKMLPMLGLVAYHIPSRCPEFLPKFNSTLDAWQIQHAYDSEGLRLLNSALRGDVQAIGDLVKHSEAQIAGHFVMLRQECMQGSEAEVEATTTSDETANAIFPQHVACVLKDWENAAAGEKFNDGVSQGPVTEWYRETVGNLLVKSISGIRSDLDLRYSLDRFKTMNLEDLKRSMGQVSVLMRREFLSRVQLLQEELQMISMLDSRHAVLVKKHDVYARLLYILTSLDET